MDTDLAGSDVSLSEQALEGAALGEQAVEVHAIPPEALLFEIVRVVDEETDMPMHGFVRGALVQAVGVNLLMRDLAVSGIGADAYVHSRTGRAQCLMSAHVPLECLGPLTPAAAEVLRALVED